MCSLYFDIGSTVLTFNVRKSSASSVGPLASMEALMMGMTLTHARNAARLQSRLFVIVCYILESAI